MKLMMRVSRIILVALILTALIVPILPATPAGAQSWWNASWTHRKILSFDAREINEDLIDFPVGVFLTSDNFDFENAKADGSDIRFVDKDGTTELYFEVVEWTYIGPGDSGNFAEIWVNVPQVDQSTGWTDYIYLYYGNPSASDASNPTLVWDEHFAAVYHMNDGADNAHIYDSTANANHGTKTAANEPLEVEGLKGKAQSFDGVDDYINCGLLEEQITNRLTMEWFGEIEEPLALSTIELVGKGNTALPRRGYRLYCYGSWLYTQVSSALSDDLVTSSARISYNQAVYTVGTMDGAGVLSYVNGIPGTLSPREEADIGNDTLDLRIGRYAQSGSYFLEGIASEVRISNIARSASWIAATNATLRDEFIYYGSTYLEPSLYTQSANPSTVLVGDTITLRARLTDLGGMPASEVWFEYGLDTSYGTSTTHAVISSPSAVTAEVTIPHGNYHYRAVASNDHGTVYGMDSSFTLLPPSDTTGALYRSLVTLSNSGDAASNVSVASTNINSPGLVSGRFSNATLSNLVLRNAAGADVPYMPGYESNPWIMYLPSIAGNSALNYNLYMAHSSGGKLAYFPGDAGMTVNDAAALELGDNFEIEVSGCIDTNKLGTIMSKGTAYIIATDGGKLISGIPSTTLSSMGSITTATATALNYSPTNTRMGNRFAAAASPRIIHELSQRMKRTGSPTGYCYARIYRASDGELLGTIGEKSVSQIGTSITTITISGGAVFVPANTEIYAVIEYTESTGTDYITTHSKEEGSDAFVSYSSSSGLWNVGSNCTNTRCGYSDITLYDEIALAPGAHTIVASADGTNYTVNIDGTNMSTTPWAGTIADNSNGYIYFANGSMPYVDYLKLTINGTLQQHLVYQYAETPVIDISGQNNQPSSVSVRTTSSDPDVSASLISFSPVNESVASDIGVSGISSSPIATAPTQPDKMYEEPDGTGEIKLPGAAVINDLLDASNTPYAFFWLPVVGTIIIFASYYTYKFAPSLLVKAAANWVLFIFFAAVGVFGFWTFVLFFICSWTMIVHSRSYGL
jgi:hypothetical protein